MRKPKQTQMKSKKLQQAKQDERVKGKQRDTVNTKQKILELYNNPDYQALSSYYNKTTVMNVFGIERSENRHSSFLRWLLDNRSGHGLGYAPIKKFLRLYALALSQEQDRQLQNMLLIGDYDIVYTEHPTTEKVIQKDKGTKTKGRNARIDLWARMELTDRQGTSINAVLAIENKVYSIEGKEQTKDYHKYLLQNKAEDECPIEVYLTPSDVPKPACPEFKHLFYQELLQTVLEPLSNMVHAPSAQWILTDYIRNLGKPSTGEDGKKFTILATSQSEEARLRGIGKQFQDLIWAALVAGNMEQIVKRLKKTNALSIVQSLGKVGLVENIPAKATVQVCRRLIEQMDERDLLESLWNANEDLFAAVISATGCPTCSIDLEKIWGTSNRDTTKYSVEVDGKSFGHRLSKARAALAIFKAYTERFPHATIYDLRRAFPGSVNQCYSTRLFKYLFYPAAHDEPPYDVEGNRFGKKGNIEWDFFNNDNDVLRLDNGRQRAMAIKMWRKEDFDNLRKHVDSQTSLKFIKVAPTQE